LQVCVAQAPHSTVPPQPSLTVPHSLALQVVLVFVQQAPVVAWQTWPAVQQLPAQQIWPVPQVVPDVTFWSVQVWPEQVAVWQTLDGVGQVTQAPLQLVWPPVQTQVVPEQDPPVGHATQTPPQQVLPPVQSVLVRQATQEPEEQYGVEPEQTAPPAPAQAPQLAGSVWVLVQPEEQQELAQHVPAQLNWLPGQVQMPELQVAPDGQTLVQLPQAEASVWRLRQVPLQQVWPAEQPAVGEQAWQVAALPVPTQ